MTRKDGVMNVQVREEDCDRMDPIAVKQFGHVKRMSEESLTKI